MSYCNCCWSSVMYFFSASFTNSFPVSFAVLLAIALKGEKCRVNPNATDWEWIFSRWVVEGRGRLGGKETLEGGKERGMDGGREGVTMWNKGHSTHVTQEQIYAETKKNVAVVCIYHSCHRSKYGTRCVILGVRPGKARVWRQHCVLRCFPPKYFLCPKICARNKCCASGKTSQHLGPHHGSNVPATMFCRPSTTAKVPYQTMRVPTPTRCFPSPSILNLLVCFRFFPLLFL